MLMNTGTEPVQSKAGLLTTLAYQFGNDKPHYALEGAIAITGALVQWLRDNLQLFEASADIEALAASVTDNGDVYIVPAFSGLYAPYWKDDARGVIAGLTRYATRAHIARAALESTAYQVRDVVEAMQEDSGIKLATLKTDGGMVANELLMQFQADILDVPVLRPTVRETTALGAAYAAGLATGYWHNTEDLRANWGIDKIFIPSMGRKPVRITTSPGRRRWRGRSAGWSKRFFFEKKNQKTFVLLAVACGTAVASGTIPSSKVFLLLFVHKKKSYLTSCNTLALPAPQSAPPYTPPPPRQSPSPAHPP